VTRGRRPAAGSVASGHEAGGKRGVDLLASCLCLVPILAVSTDRKPGGCSLGGEPRNGAGHHVELEAPDAMTSEMGPIPRR
jgi:hypothetical protein